MCLQGDYLHRRILPIYRILVTIPKMGLPPKFEDIRIKNMYDANGFLADNWESELANRSETWIITQLHYSKSGRGRAIRKTSGDRNWNARQGKEYKTSTLWREVPYKLTKRKSANGGNKFPKYTMIEFTPKEERPEYALCKITRGRQEDAQTQDNRPHLFSQGTAQNQSNNFKVMAEMNYNQNYTMINFPIYNSNSLPTAPDVFGFGERNQTNAIMEQGAPSNSISAEPVDAQMADSPYGLMGLGLDNGGSYRTTMNIPFLHGNNHGYSSPSNFLPGGDTEYSTGPHRKTPAQMLDENNSNYQSDEGLNEVFGRGPLLRPSISDQQNPSTNHPAAELWNSRDTACPYGYNTANQANNLSTHVLQSNWILTNGLPNNLDLTNMSSSSFGPTASQLGESPLLDPNTNNYMHTAPHNEGRNFTNNNSFPTTPIFGFGEMNQINTMEQGAHSSILAQPVNAPMAASPDVLMDIGLHNEGSYSLMNYGHPLGHDHNHGDNSAPDFLGLDQNAQEIIDMCASAQLEDYY